MKRRKKEGSKANSALSTSHGLRCFCQTWQNAWLVGLDASMVSFLFIFFPTPYLPLNWGQGPLGPGSIVLKENCQSGLLWLNSAGRSFMKELICYSLPLSYSFSHTPLFSVGWLCHTPTSFLGLFLFSLYFMFTHFFLCWFPLRGPLWQV